MRLVRWLVVISVVYVGLLHACYPSSAAAALAPFPREARPVAGGEDAQALPRRCPPSGLLARAVG